MARTLSIEETEYESLRRAARSAGVSVEILLKRWISQHQMTSAEPSTPALAGKPEPQKKSSRWARVSQQIQQSPPLHGLSHTIRNMTSDFREDLSMIQDDEIEE